MRFWIRLTLLSQSNITVCITKNCHSHTHNKRTEIFRSSLLGFISGTSVRNKFCFCFLSPVLSASATSPCPSVVLLRRSFLSLQYIFHSFQYFVKSLNVVQTSTRALSVHTKKQFVCFSRSNVDNKNFHTNIHHIWASPRPELYNTMNLYSTTSKFKSVDNITII